MTTQLTRTHDTEPLAAAPRTRRWVWLAALLVAMAATAVAGVAVTAQVTRPAPHNSNVYLEPNANTREGRVPTYQEPNANTREDRVSIPTGREPNANTREGRVPINR